jgi:histidinol-phosphate aminotransferase
MTKLKSQLLSIQPYKPGKRIEEVQKELGLSSVEKLASNENPFGYSPKAKAAIEKTINDLMIYPDGYATDLRATLSQHLNVDESRLIFGNGSDEIIHMLSRSILMPGMNSVMAAPTFPNYKRNALIDGAEVREVSLVNGHHDLSGMLDQVDENTGIVWICNPNNPTGIYIPESDFISFMESVPSDILVVCDEAYREYVTAVDFPNTIELMNRFPNLFVTRTFSKAYGLAGLRVGYGIGSDGFVQKIEPAREPFNVSVVAQAAAMGALSDQEFLNNAVEKNVQGRDQYYEFCKEHNLDFYPTQGNFILIDFQTSGDIIFNYLLKRGVIVRSGVGLGCPTAVRITIGTSEQNACVIKYLKEFLNDN